MTELNEQLLTCAHCGGACQVTKGGATAEVWPHGTFYRVFCTSCQVRQLFHRTEAEAIAAWNRRSPASPAVQPPADERAAFEKWAVEEGPWLEHALHRLSDDSYAEDELRDQWEVWQARAALAVSTVPAAPAGLHDEIMAVNLSGHQYAHDALEKAAYRCGVRDMQKAAAKLAGQPPAQPALQADAGVDAKDAARYRWLRNPDVDVALVLDKCTGYVPEDESFPGIGGYHTYEYRAGDELDEAIDAAMSGSALTSAVEVKP